MSGYDKPEDYGYEEYEQNTRPSQPANYPGFAQPNPSFGTPPSYTPSSQAAQPLHGIPIAHPISVLSASVPTYPPRDQPSLEPPSTSSYIEPRAHFVSPTIIPAAPYQGSAGENFRIFLQTDTRHAYDRYSFSFHFGGYQSCKGELKQETWEEGKYRTPLEVQVPDLGANSITMPLMLEIHDENSALLEQKALGQFVYGSSGYPSYPTVGGKRKFSEDSSEYFHIQAKRSASQPLQPSKFKDSSPAYSGHPVPLPTGSSYSSSLYGMSSYDRPSQPSRSNYGTYSGSRTPYGGYSMNPSPAPQSVKARSPTRGQYAALTQSQSPRIQSQQLTSAGIGRSLSMSGSPMLIRTSMSRNPSLSAVTMTPVHPAFNPYAIYPNAKATLNIHGDLQSMCQGWTSVEKAAKRRLVEFSRTQIGSSIDATFRAVSPEERSPNNPCISCIYWEKKREYFCTSVDTIALLEALVAVRFTVEEKNRIRRNLEGFKPYTVSKSKDECDDIFRLIMGFPNPKPRNIEKDIKIFTWHHLGLALKKIIGKYSASYSSTSSVLTPPSSASAVYGGTMSEVSELPQSTASPVPTTRSTLSLAYPSMTSRALSPGIASASAGLEDLRPTAMHHGSHMLPSASSHLPQWQPPAYPQQFTATGLSTHSTGRSWDMSPYLEQGASTQVIPYHRGTAVERASESDADPDDPQHQASTGYVQHHQQTSRPQ